MKIWVDAQLSPQLAPWIHHNLGHETAAVRDLGLRDATDMTIFKAARDALAVVLTKDGDFPHLLAQHGPPPQIIWLTCGNTSNKHLQDLLKSALPRAVAYLQAGESLVEISGP